MAYSVVIGLGETGFSCARYLKKNNISFMMMDSRENPPGLLKFQQTFPDIPIHLGNFEKSLIDAAENIIMSPGVSPSNFPTLKTIGDIELFARAAQAPIIGITGTNAKGTVTTLLGEMIQHAGFNVLLGGNIGVPALDLLDHPVPDFYVLEISSFQLETTHHLPLAAATILNLSPDHLDRHHTMENYQQIKQRIYRQARVAVFNRNDPATFPMFPCAQQFSFGFDAPRTQEFGLSEGYLMRGEEKLFPTKTLKIQGKHNWLNALSALALGKAIDLPIEKMRDVLKTFPGLPHRCEWVTSQNNIHWYNDSKGTNIGATIAALEGFGETLPARKIILIAGGVGKDQDFRLLKESVEKYTKQVILIGQDAPRIHQVLKDKSLLAASLQEAVSIAKKIAVKEDIVLLSPACASLDQFKNFEDRGNQFKMLVKDLYRA
jgi:UDP-N-acetylmuramoylalanine--D-glutamate ligase